MQTPLGNPPYPDSPYPDPPDTSTSRWFTSYWNAFLFENFFSIFVRPNISKRKGTSGNNLTFFDTNIFFKSSYLSLLLSAKIKRAQQHMEPQYSFGEKQITILTRMHSSGMRTVRCSGRYIPACTGQGVCISQHALDRGVCIPACTRQGLSAQGGVCPGVSARRRCLPGMCLPHTPL